MDDTRLSQMASGVAVALSEKDGKHWTVTSSRQGAQRGFGVDITTGDGEVVNFQEARQPGRVAIEGCDPLTAYSVGPAITVSATRARYDIAREVSRRLLPAYREELTARRAREAQGRAAFAARAAVVNAAEALFGAPTDFGTLHPAARGEVTYKTGARLALRGRRVRETGRRGPIADAESARVETTGNGELVDLSLKEIPAEVAMRMLRVLADYTAMWPELDEDAVPEPAPFSAEFERLYDEFVFGGHAQRMTWEQFLKDSRWRAPAV